MSVRTLFSVNAQPCKGVRRAFDCGRRARPFLGRALRKQRKLRTPLHHTLQARSLFSQGWGLIDLPLRASYEGLLRPRVARAQEINSLHSLLCSNHLLRGVAKAALYCAHRMSTIINGPSKLARIFPHRAAWSILECARRTSTFLSCAFREQEDDRLPAHTHSSVMGNYLRTCYKSFPSC